MSQEAVAIIGFDLRFPGAADADAYWRNLRAGVESTTFFSAEELAAAGVAPALLADPRYVRANGVLAGAADFDAEFFGFAPREAELTDPQHRVLLELAWTAFENAGYDPARMTGRAGVFVGAGMSTYLLKHLAPNRAVVESAGELALNLGNNKDFAPTRISYKLDLRGPSIAVNTACSTSLVAVHLACQSLLDYHCDVALAGGASIQFPQEQGYLCAAGGIGSPDGRCRAFDARAQGTVGGSGAGLVVLKRLTDALADRDPIRAIIRGSAVNNDGSAKVGYTAPSVEGQTQVIAEAQAMAGIEPRQISYVEAHGTGTELGDPIEVAALTRAFRARTADRGFCALGSVKTNFGHLDEAAGMAGLLKVVLALQHRELPPTLHFTAPHPKIDFASSPFFVNARLTPWKPEAGEPLRAGVSSFGIGGTNAHLVVEAAPAGMPDPEAAGSRLLLLAARTPAALERMSRRLADFLESRPDVRLEDAAFTLAVGRRHFACRRFVAAADAAGAAALLRGTDVAGGTGLPPGLLGAAREWLDGAAIDWAARWGPFGGRRIALPGYPFERQRYWIAPQGEAAAAERLDATGKRSEVDEWFYSASWRRVEAPRPAGSPRSILWLGEGEPAQAATAAFRSAGHRVEIAGDHAESRAAWEAVLARHPGLTDVVHAGQAGPLAPEADTEEVWLKAFPGILNLVQTVAALGGVRLTVVTTHAVQVSGDEWLQPARAALIGLCRVAGQEYPALACRLVDVTGLAPAVWGSRLAAEVAGSAGEGLIALRGAHRWLPGCEPLRLAAPAGQARLRRRGVYLITGGLGAVGSTIAEFLARSVQARLVLASRTGVRGTSVPVAIGPAPVRPEEPRFTEFSAAADSLCAAFAEAYLRSGDPDGAGPAPTRAELLRRLAVKPPFETFIDYFLTLLAEDGRLRLEGGSIRWTAPGGGASAEALADAAAAAYPEFAGAVDLLRHCARHYAAALSGAIPAIGVLYPEGRSDLLEAAGRRMARHSNKDDRIEQLRGLVVRTAAEAGRGIRVLEVGVGDGLLAGRIAPALAGAGAEYVATDLSRAFVIKAEKAAREAGLGFVSFGVLDISRDPAGQGFAPGSFDLVIALDVVHATPRLAATLEHLRRLLVPGGRLGLIEKVWDDRWTNLVWGLAEGWWSFEDVALRPRGPLLPAAAWERILREGGWSAVQAADGSAGPGSDYALLVAARASDADGRAETVRRLERLGAEVMVEEADVTDAAQVRVVAGRARSRFGAIHGVVHAAGVTDGAVIFNLLPDATAEQARRLFRAKVGGAENLAAALAGDALDFAVLISSNAGVLGGLGLAAYAAANTAVDALAAELRRRNAGEWVSATWDGWPAGGGAGRLQVQTSIDQFAMTPPEAEAAFVRVLGAPVGCVHVSAGDLRARLRRWVDARPAAAAAHAPKAAALHARPASAGPYAAPRSATEQGLAALWSELLGIDQVGADDNFFDLDGDSLLGTQLVARIGKDFGAAVSVGVLFEAPTLAALAERIERARAAGTPPTAPVLADPRTTADEEGAL